MFIYCDKKKEIINSKLEENCPSCIFNKQKEDEDGYFYLVCDYSEEK